MERALISEQLLAALGNRENEQSILELEGEHVLVISPVLQEV
jgi:hypothetical protein